MYPEFPEYPEGYKPASWKDEDGFELSYSSDRDPFYWLWSKILIGADCPDAPPKPNGLTGDCLLVVKFNDQLGYVWLDEPSMDDVNFDIWASVSSQLKEQFHITT
jgi:hypothetical protein